MDKTFKVNQDMKSNDYIIFDKSEGMDVFKGSLADCNAYIELILKGYLET